MRAAVDAHTHLDFPSLSASLEQVRDRAHRAGVGGVVLAGADPGHWGRVARVARRWGAWFALGVHPWWVSEQPAARRGRIRQLAQQEGMHGIGETGLDHHRARDLAARAAQRASLRDHLALARERELPVVIHCVRAHAELLRVLRADGLPRAGGMVHGWTGPAEAAAELIGLGLHISLGPAICREGAQRARQSARRLPLARLLVETDCPDQPLPRRSTSEPADVLEVARTLAELRGQPVEEVVERTADSARELFGSAPAPEPVEVPDGLATLRR